jgi:phosphotriesterase-related protein
MMIRTVLGDIKPDQLGLTLAHEHLIGQPPAEFAEPDLTLDSEEAAVEELGFFKQAGGSAVVEMTTIDYGRNVEALVRISRASGVHIIAVTGLNQARFADRFSQDKSLNQMAHCLTHDVFAGFGNTDFRAGVIKASSSLNGAGVNEIKVFEAAIQAHHTTGAPLSTHTEKGTWALGQIELFRKNLVDPKRVLIGHLDLKPDLPYLKEVASTGVYLGLDQFSKEKYLPDTRRVELVMALCQAGYIHQLLLSGDLARRSYWQHYGGPGFAHIPSTLVPMLIGAGLSQSQVQTILVHNPREWLAFSP